MTTKNPTCDASSSMPRSRAIRKAATMIPKTPPEAPTVTTFGSTTSEPSAPPRIETM